MLLRLCVCESEGLGRQFTLNGRDVGGRSLTLIYLEPAFLYALGQCLCAHCLIYPLKELKQHWVLISFFLNR